MFHINIRTAVFQKKNHFQFDFTLSPDNKKNLTHPLVLAENCWQRVPWLHFNQQLLSFCDYKVCSTSESLSRLVTSTFSLRKFQTDSLQTSAIVQRSVDQRGCRDDTNSQPQQVVSHKHKNSNIPKKKNHLQFDFTLSPDNMQNLTHPLVLAENCWYRVSSLHFNWHLLSFFD